MQSGASMRAGGVEKPQLPEHLLFGCTLHLAEKDWLEQSKGQVESVLLTLRTPRRVTICWLSSTQHPLASCEP